MSKHAPLSALEKTFFVDIYQQHKILVRSVLFKIIGSQEIDDVEQEVFFKIWRKYDTFSKKSSLKTWIYRITVNAALDYCRAKKRHHLQLVENYEIADDKPKLTVEGKDFVLKGLQTLTPAHRAVITLQVFEGLSIAEISDVLNVAPGTVKSRIFHAKATLKRFFEEQGVDL